jgi:uncharacterized phage protein (TIGR01671 family)
MNRPIKFRAWDKNEKVMCPVKVTNWEKGCFLLGNSPTPVQWLDDRSYVDEVPEGHFVDFEDMVLMQYTGLETEDGNEVYEGDIFFNSDRNEHGFVAWSAEKGMFVTQYPESEDSWPLWETIGNLYEIVGNIYSNPQIKKP